MNSFKKIRKRDHHTLRSHVVDGEEQNELLLLCDELDTKIAEEVDRKFGKAGDAQTEAEKLRDRVKKRRCLEKKENDDELEPHLAAFMAESAKRESRRINYKKEDLKLKDKLVDGIQAMAGALEQFNVDKADLVEEVVVWIEDNVDEKDQDRYTELVEDEKNEKKVEKSQKK